MNDQMMNETMLPAATPMASNGMDLGGVDAKDIILPRLSLMQGLSDAVAEGNAAMGDILNSVSGEKLGGKDQPTVVIPIRMYKTATVYDVSGPKPKFLKEVPWSPEVEARCFSKEPLLGDNGERIRYDRAINAYMLVAKEVSEGMAFPYLITFRRTSYMAGRKLSTHFAKAAATRQPAYGFAMSLMSQLQKNDLGTYYTWDVGFARKATADEMASAKEWKTFLEQQAVVVAPEVSAEAKPQAPSDDLAY